jgi:dephospho-CoA kinase
MNPGEPVYNQVVRHFGREIVNPDGSVNRPKLAELAFGAPDLPEDQRGSRVAELNRIVHPAVIRSQEEWMQAIGAQNRNAVAIVEAALILEAGMAKRFDRLIVVTCAPEQRAARFAARQKMDLESANKEVQRRMAAQLPDEEKVKAADYVIDNSGSLATTRAQVADIWKKLQSEASSTTS